MEPGDERIWQARGRFSVVSGRPWGVVFSLQEHPLPWVKPGLSGVLRITVTRTGVKREKPHPAPLSDSLSSPSMVSEPRIGGRGSQEPDLAREIADRAGGNKRGLRIRSSADIEKDFELPSYARVENIQELTEEERAALLALGWFAREQVANWPRIYQRASVQASTLDDAYQISYGRYWLTGLDRWEKKPRPFKAGQRYST